MIRHRAALASRIPWTLVVFLVAVWVPWVGSRYDTLVAEGHRLLEIKATLEGVSANVRLEFRRAFEHDFPSPDLAPSLEPLLEQCLPYYERLSGNKIKVEIPNG